MTRLSICTTNYNCAHALERHLSSAYKALDGLDFEYIVVDNESRDGSPGILEDWSSTHRNMIVRTRRCTMGRGRQVAFEESSGNYIIVLDTDVVYSDLLRRFVDTYVARFSDLSMQALYCGIFPRAQWAAAGGRRSLNTNEDVDMWLRVARLGTMRWYPLALGVNLKESDAMGSSDHLSNRYGRGERVVRLVRREWDFLKTRGSEQVDLDRLIRSNTVDLGLAPEVGPWPQNRTPQAGFFRAVRLVRDLRVALRSS